MKESGNHIISGGKVELEQVWEVNRRASSQILSCQVLLNFKKNYHTRLWMQLGMVS